MTVVVCIPSLLAVVVSLKNCPAPPVLYVYDKVNTATVLVYDNKYKRIVRVYVI